MAGILHITKRGHKCRSTLKTPPASYIQAGEVLGLGQWLLFYDNHQRAYIVCRDDKTGDYYQFNNYKCALAQLEGLNGGR